MSDPNVRKKGMRTFASDFERAKESNPQPKKPDTTNVPAKKPIPVPKPDTKNIVPSPTISKTIQKPDAPKKIPAFHELEKSLGNINLSDTGKKETSHKKKHHRKGITPSKAVGGGAIITDTKTSSFSLFGETKKSISSWFKKRKKKPTPKLAVPKAERRKGVIQQATTKSGTIFTADNETLKERIKARKLQEQNKPDEPETNWSPYTETGFSLLESGEEESQELPTTNNVQVEFKKRSVPMPEPAASASTPTQTPEPEPVSKPEPTVEPEVSPTKPEPESQTTTESEPVAVPVPQVTTPPDPVPEPEPVAEPVSAPEVEQPIAPEPVTTQTLPTERAAQNNEPLAKKASLTTNQLTMYVSGGVALVLLTGFFGWVVMNSESTASENNDPEVHKLVDLATTEVITVDQTFTTDVLRSYTGSAAYTEVVLINADQELLPAALVFELVAPDIPTTIQQFATDVRFIQFGTTPPQITVSIADPISVTGALLVRESELISAMDPLYGQFENGSFTDSSIAGVDVRVLETNTRQTLTYGIINGDTLVITSSPDSFAEIVTLIGS